MERNALFPADFLGLQRQAIGGQYVAALVDGAGVLTLPAGLLAKPLRNLPNAFSGHTNAASDLRECDTWFFK